MLEVSGNADAEDLRGPRAVSIAERSDELIWRPYVERAFHAVAVGIERRGEAAFGRPQLGDHPVAGLLSDPTCERVSGSPPQMRVDPGQQRVVVEHLLEMRDHPIRVHAVAGEPADQLVVDAAAGHGLGRCLGHHQGLLARVFASPLGVPEQKFQHHGRRELGRAAESAPAGVELACKPGHRRPRLPRRARPHPPRRR